MWSLRDYEAELRTEWMRARLDLLRPFRGLEDLQVGAQGATPESLPGGRILQTVFAAGKGQPLKVVDSHVRGDDLVVQYALAAADLAVEIDWRIRQPADAALIGLELIVSASTSSLDADPSCRVESLLPAEHLLWLDSRGERSFARVVPGQEGQVLAVAEGSPGVMLFRLPGRTLSYVEMVYPPCSCGMVATIEDPSAALVRCSFRLFAERVEKGVLRRGCCRGYFLPRECDERTAMALHGQLRVSDPPLSD